MPSKDKEKNREQSRRWSNTAKGREYQKIKVRQYKAEGKCHCGRSRVGKRLCCDVCTADKRERTRVRRAACEAAGLCSRCGWAPKEQGRSLCSVCFEKTRATRQALKLEVMAAYGGRCVCCGESNHNFLSIDHIFNDGQARRKEEGAGTVFYYWLRDRGFPQDRYRCLCLNCNFGRRINGGICPHEEQRAKVAAEAKPAPKPRPAKPVCRKPTLF